MKLNHDCIRDVLLYLEDALCFAEEDCAVKFQPIFFHELSSSENLRSYPKEVVFYSIHNLKQAGYISASIRYDLGIYDYCSVSDITFEGHQFLSQIRDDKRWAFIKSATSSIRDYSLAAISSVAEGVTSAAISSFFSKEKGRQLFSL